MSAGTARASWCSMTGSQEARVTPSSLTRTSSTTTSSAPERGHAGEYPRRQRPVAGPTQTLVLTTSGGHPRPAIHSGGIVVWPTRTHQRDNPNLTRSPPKPSSESPADLRWDGTEPACGSRPTVARRQSRQDSVTDVTRHVSAQQSFHRVLTCRSSRTAVPVRVALPGLLQPGPRAGKLKLALRPPRWRTRGFDTASGIGRKR